MPKNKNKPNAFLYFMLDWKKEEEKKGRKFHDGLKQVQIDPICNKMWRNLSEEKKSYYKILAKNDKTQTIKPKKRTGNGDLVEDVNRIEMKKGEFNDNMKESISSLINNAKKNNNVQDLIFYAIHVNFFYSRYLDNSNIEYYPAEISILEFSLKKGILRRYHVIVNETIKIGYSNAARSHSMNTHQIPLNPEFGKKDYKEIFRDICKFLEPGKKNDKFPKLYTFASKEDVYLPAKYVLNMLGIADNKPNDFLVLYSLENLFVSLYNTGVKDFPSLKIDITIAKFELEKDPFIYKRVLECTYHRANKGGILYCSQSIVERWIFVLFSFCCDVLKISKIPGVHIPQQNSEFISEFEIDSKFRNLNLNTDKSNLNSSERTDSDHKYTNKGSNINKHSTSRTEINENLTGIIVYRESNKSLQNQPQKVIERSLRHPYTKSATIYIEGDDKDKDFPSIGRGKRR